MVHEGLEPQEELLENESNRKKHWNISEGTHNISSKRNSSQQCVKQGHDTEGLQPILTL